MTENDLEHLLQLLEVGNATREWQFMMDKTTPNMSYQAWRHEPQVISILILALCPSPYHTHVEKMNPLEIFVWHLIQRSCF